MMQTKIITTHEPGSLESLVNRYLKEYQEAGHTIIAIHYTTVDNDQPNYHRVIFSAMIIYQIKQD